MDHLVKYRLGHWDASIREIASKSMAVICANTSECTRQYTPDVY